MDGKEYTKEQSMKDHGSKELKKCIRKFEKMSPKDYNLLADKTNFRELNEPISTLTSKEQMSSVLLNQFKEEKNISTDMELHSGGLWSKYIQWLENLVFKQQKAIDFLGTPEKIITIKDNPENIDISKDANIVNEFITEDCFSVDVEEAWERLFKELVDKNKPKIERYY